MNKILSIQQDDMDFLEEVEEQVSQYPIHLQGRAREAFGASAEGDLEKAVELCQNLLDYEDRPSTRMLLGICYFRMGKLPMARKIFSDLTADYPEEEQYCIYLGMTDHALGNFEAAVKELESLHPLNMHHPFYYTSYGDSLFRMGKLKESRDIFREEVAFFENTGIIASAEMLDGAFQNLLYLDITLGNGKYPEDIKVYYRFLDQTEMTEEMQEYVAGNIVYLCGLMENKWYRPLFLELVTHIRDSGFLTDEAPATVLESAFASWESYAYHEDRKIDAVVEVYLSTNYQKKYTLTEALSEREQMEIRLKSLTYEWYMCQYLPEHPEVVHYIKDTYPYTYANNRDFFDRVISDAAGTAEKLADELYPYEKKKSRREFVESLFQVYKKACEQKKMPEYVYDGTDPYRRMQPKVGRNDPCPCGSGKKYKKCCGK